MSTKPSEGAVKAADDYDALKSDLARVTAERQNWKEWAEEARAMFHKQIDAAAVMKTRAEQAEQRVADLEADASLHWITDEELKQSRARVADLQQQLDNLTASVNTNGK